MGTRPAILIDTNIIIEAVRVGAFSRLRAHGRLTTMKRCCEEALSGIPGWSGRVSVIEADLAPPLVVLDVEDAQRVHAALRHADLSVLGDGERDLLTYAFVCAGAADGGDTGAMGRALKKAGFAVNNSGDDFRIATADQAAVRVAIAMGFGDRLTSLEEMLRDAGIKANAKFKRHYTRAALVEWKTRHRLGG